MRGAHWAISTSCRYYPLTSQHDKRRSHSIHALKIVAAVSDQRKFLVNFSSTSPILSLLLVICFFSTIITTTVDKQFQYIVYMNLTMNCEFECVPHQTAQLTGHLDEALHAHLIAKSKIFLKPVSPHPPFCCSQCNRLCGNLGDKLGCPYKEY